MKPKEKREVSELRALLANPEALLALLEPLIATNVYDFGGIPFEMKPFTGRDVTAITGKLAILPMNGTGKVAAYKSNELADQLLVLCSVKPKLTLEDPEEIPAGTIPVRRLPDATFYDLIAALSRDSGFSAEAAEEIRPTSGTETSS